MNNQPGPLLTTLSDGTMAVSIHNCNVYLPNRNQWDEEDDAILSFLLGSATRASREVEPGVWKHTFGFADPLYDPFPGASYHIEIKPPQHLSWLYRKGRPLKQRGKRC